MPALSRLYDFTPATTIVSAEVDAELDQIINALTGAKVNSPYTLRYNASDVPTLKVDNTGSGVVASFQVGGVEKAKVNASGQVESVLATGTAPLVVASTTKVTNLNADQVDGVEGTAIVRNDQSNTIVAADPYLDFDDSGADDTLRVQNLNGDFLVKNTTDNQNLLLIDGDTELATFYGKVAGVAATADDQFVTKAQLAAALHYTQIGGFFEGAPAVGQRGYMYPINANLGASETITRLISAAVCDMTGGSGTTTFVLKLYKVDFSASTTLVTLSITGAVSGFAAAYDAGGVALPAGYDQGFLVWECTAVGTHQNISVSTFLTFVVP